MSWEPVTEQRLPIAKIAVSAATFWVDRPYDYYIPIELADQVRPGVRVIVPFGMGNRRSEGIVLQCTPKSTYQNVKAITTVLDDSPILSREQLKLALWMRERFFCTVYDGIKGMLPVGLWYQVQSIYRIAEGQDTDVILQKAQKIKYGFEVIKIVIDAGGHCDVSQIEKQCAAEDIRSVLKSLVKKGLLFTDTQEKRRVQDKKRIHAVLTISTEEAAVLARQKKRRAPVQAAALELLCDAGVAAASELSYFTGVTMGTLRKLEESGYLSLQEEEIFRRPKYREGQSSTLPELSEQQQSVYTGLCSLLEKQEASAALLFGITGSGKTAVYVHLIQRALAAGKTAILMVPEIALTPQTLELFSSYFGTQIAVLHSLLTTGERYDEWKRIKNGTARVVVGTRSAVFAPVEDLGIIIIDEEQESSYKSENVPRYHARDVAKFRCVHHKALLLLGSATPDIESNYYAAIGRYTKFQLTERYNQKALPCVTIVDMKKQLRQGNMGNISTVLHRELERNLEMGQQSILFLNRRGTHQLITCVDCGYVYECTNCSVSLTYHGAKKRLLCHYCGQVRLPDDVCPQCQGHLSYVGAGTQKVVDELEALFPGTEILRMDADTVAPVGSHEALLHRFVEQKIPIMVGTQMVTKGLNFDNVTLVGVISADQALYAGDYRANERTFSLITQVVGRSGRGAKPGRAVIQTFTPQNQTILQAAEQDYESFYHAEISLRQLQQSPPFVDMYGLVVSGVSESMVLTCCTEIRSMLMQGLQHISEKRILGPAPLRIVRVKNRFRYRITLACKSNRDVRARIADIIAYCSTNKKYKGISVFADAYPME